MGHPDRPHATLADFFNELVRTDHRAGLLTAGLVGGSEWAERRRIQEAAGLRVLAQQGVHLPAQLLVLATGFPHVGVPPDRVRYLDGGKKDLFDAPELGIHDTTSV